MKKSILSLAVAAGISGTATAAMHINHQGVGEALVYPLYSTQNGNDTYIHVVNTTSQAKAVKVRILEAKNSWEVLDFNLYMSPNDHFSFALTEGEEGGAQLITADKSCTVPTIDAPIPLKTLLFADEEDGSEARLQIGHIEVIEMGQIDSESVVYDATLHGSDGVPADCDAHTALWTEGGAWFDEVETDGTASTGFVTDWMGGGLYGMGQVINVANGTAFGYDAIAIADLVAEGASGSALHYFPGDTRPRFTDAAIDNVAIVETQAGSEMIAVADPITAVTSLFQTTILENDFVVDPAINATTDWVLTQPTKFYHTQAEPALAPYSVSWDGTDACEPVTFDNWDREEQFIMVEEVTPTPETPVFSPSVPPEDPERPEVPDLLLCWETTILQFGAESALNAENVVATMSPDLLAGDEGWARLTFFPEGLNETNRGVVGTNRRIDYDSNADQVADGFLNGMPVTGFAVVKYTNSSANEAGALANYAVSTEHKSATISSALVQ